MLGGQPVFEARVSDPLAELPVLLLNCSGLDEAPPGLVVHHLRRESAPRTLVGPGACAALVPTIGDVGDAFHYFFVLLVELLALHRPAHFPVITLAIQILINVVVALGTGVVDQSLDFAQVLLVGEVVVAEADDLADFIESAFLFHCF